MRSNLFLFKQILIMGICIAFLSCTSTNKDKFPEPKIMMGTAKVTGSITNLQLKDGDEKPIIRLRVPNPVTGEPSMLETYLNKDGSFSFEVPMESNFMIGIISSEILRTGLIIGLASQEETKLIITKKDDENIEVNISSRIELTSNDVLNFGDTINQMMMMENQDSYSSDYKMSPTDFARITIQNMEKTLNIILNDTILSKSAQNFGMNEFKLFYLASYLLDYDFYISKTHKDIKTTEDSKEFTPQKLEKSYFTFLKDFNLNDPQYLYNGSYSRVLKNILFNETLNIPLIKDSPINEWLKQVKATMTDLIGADSGLFYDMLVINAYIAQFDNEVQPLSDKQIENIKSYFKNEEITKILLKKNDDIMKVAQYNSNPVVKETPAVPLKELMPAIINQYKDKIVLVDFWTTSCGPCLEAMKEFREAKDSYKNKDIVFVYITNTSSPLNLWKDKIKGIGGEHYYLTKGEWKSLQDSFDFIGIPTYQLYDINGKLEKQFSGYPGTNEMKTMIEQLLP
ncbi:TlpA family protein disulfide reductase [Dysgonomonas sp. GY617]|uniref:TlpA family protein disulfide reductase n=1 Tax=Dysgonomonas sp. GY617 TaxID=2780420 RepID=UPI001883ACCE|nr:TlpA disulfide reductase family protein [Dysgonomonas sp. GY617]MBF0574880.1 TlpA family protein disulfide reductase [Dysgonomonas sp. GY617]